MKKHEKILFSCLISYFSIFIVLFYWGFSGYLLSGENLDLTSKIASILGAIFTAVAAYISYKSAVESKKSAEINLYLSTISSRTVVKNAVFESHYLLSKDIYINWEEKDKIKLSGKDKHRLCFTKEEINKIQKCRQTINNPTHLLDVDLTEQLGQFFDRVCRLVKDQRCHRINMREDDDFEIKKEEYDRWMSDRLDLYKVSDTFINRLNDSLLPPK